MVVSKDTVELRTSSVDHPAGSTLGRFGPVPLELRRQQLVRAYRFKKDPMTPEISAESLPASERPARNIPASPAVAAIFPQIIPFHHVFKVTE